MNVIDVAAGLVFRQGKVLITQRHANAHLGGLWEFPGGKREPNETFEQCLVRELREELGIEVTVGEQVESMTHTYPSPAISHPPTPKTVHLRFYCCTWDKNEPRALGCAAFKWVAPEELHHHVFPAADAHLLTRLQQDSALWTAAPE
jgi:8-oxo-dGTP diphosphatase